MIKTILPLLSNQYGTRKYPKLTYLTKPVLLLLILYRVSNLLYAKICIFFSFKLPTISILHKVMEKYVADGL